MASLASLSTSQRCSQSSGYRHVDWPAVDATRYSPASLRLNRIDDSVVLQEQQPNQVSTGQDAVATAEVASLQDQQSAQEQQSAGAPFLPPADVHRREPPSTAAAAAGGLNVHSQRASKPATAGGEASTVMQSSSPVVLKPIITGNSESSEVKQEGKGISAMDSGHLTAGGSGLAESGRANSMQSSPIFGVASAGSQAFTPMQSCAGQLRQGVNDLEVESLQMHPGHVA